MDIITDIQSNYKNGYIKLFRSLTKKGWYKKSEYVHLWIHILSKATHKEIEYFFNGKNIILKPGQFITGRKILNDETGINESKIERILNFFEKNEHQIEQQKTNKNRLISVVSWEQYQETEQQTEQQLNNKRTTTEQQLNTYKNDKNNKNEKKEEIYIFDFRNELLKLGIEKEVVSEFLKIRTKKKAVNSEIAFNRIKNEIALSGKSANFCIKIAVEKSWKGFEAEWLNNKTPKNNQTSWTEKTPQAI